MSCIHKFYNESKGVNDCDCLKSLYCNKEHCNFYQSDKYYAHDLEVESNGMRYYTVKCIKPLPKHEHLRTIKDSAGMTYRKE